jgi:Holliday junction resolvase RusA-like endonuclease
MAEATATRHLAKLTRHRQDSTIAQETRQPIILPLTLTLPFSCLVSDNKRYSATIRSGAPLLVLSAIYREAKDRIQNLARRAVGDAEPTPDPVILVGRVYLPDHRRHDLSNFCKIVHDSLEGVVYRNDTQITDLRWVKAGVDIDRPRAEITISRYQAVIHNR